MSNPLNLVDFITGFLLGSNLTVNSEALTLCNSTLENDIILNLKTAKDGLLSGDIANYFTSAFALYSVMFYSNDLVTNCFNLSLAIKTSFL